MPLTKDIFRKDCFAKLKKVTKTSLTIRNARVNFILKKRFKNITKKRVLVYSSLDFETNILKTINYLRKKNEIYSPFMEGKSFKMVPFRLPLKKNRVGIYEAGYSFKNIKKVDIAVVPIVGVDAKFQRVGFGKGMYDRFFEKLKKRPFTVFVQAKLCYTKYFVCDKYDIYGDLIVTPYVVIENKEYYKKVRKDNVKRNTNWRLNRHG